jgi:hypothetical protein
VYSDEAASEKDKIIMGHIGYAYDLSKYDPEDPATPIIRRVCAFLGDLAKLHSAHQLRWKTFQVEEPSTLKPHPMWWAQQMGHWADGLGPFERFFFELETWNELHVNIYEKPLLRSVERPREFGWMLRPSGREFDSFILQLDHLGPSEPPPGKDPPPSARRGSEDSQGDDGSQDGQQPGPEVEETSEAATKDERADPPAEDRPDHAQE